MTHKARETALQIFEMILAFGQHERRAFRLKRFEHIVENQVIARLVLGDGRHTPPAWRDGRRPLKGGGN